MQSAKVDQLAKRIWDYCNFRMPLVRSDVILVLCSSDTRIAKYAAQLYLDGWAPKLVFSGGLSAFSSKIFPKSEAESFREMAIACGVPENAIVVETQSTNTQENLQFTMELLKQKKADPEKVILVQKPNMLRRVYATATHLFPFKNFVTTSHDVSFHEAPYAHISKELLIHELVGDLHRLSVYSERGFFGPQVIEPVAWTAFLELKDMGYVKNLVQS